MTAPPLGDGSRGILIVEDDESLRRIVARHLRARGYEVEEAASAEDATGALDDGLRPGVVILDVNLPGRRSPNDSPTTSSSRRTRSSSST